MIEWGQKYHKSSDCFEYPKKSVLKSNHPKKYLPNFPTQKSPGIGIGKFRTQKNPLIIQVDHPRQLKSRNIPPTGPLSILFVLIDFFAS